VTCNWAEAGIATPTAAVRNVVERVDAGNFTGNYTALGVPPHGAVLLRVTPIA
jgi:hypothetical protein